MNSEFSFNSAERKKSFLTHHLGHSRSTYNNKKRLIREKHTHLFNLVLCDTEAFRNDDSKNQGKLSIFKLRLMKRGQVWKSAIEKVL
jgi:hypothetical protein